MVRLSGCVDVHMQFCFVVMSRMTNRDKVGMQGCIVAGLASRNGIYQIPSNLLYL